MAPAAVPGGVLIYKTPTPGTARGVVNNAYFHGRTKGFGTLVILALVINLLSEYLPAIGHIFLLTNRGHVSTAGILRRWSRSTQYLEPTPHRYFPARDHCLPSAGQQASCVPGVVC